MTNNNDQALSVLTDCKHFPAICITNGDLKPTPSLDVSLDVSFGAPAAEITGNIKTGCNISFSNKVVLLYVHGNIEGDVQITNQKKGGVLIVADSINFTENTILPKGSVVVAIEVKYNGMPIKPHSNDNITFFITPNPKYFLSSVLASSADQDSVVSCAADLIASKAFEDQQLVTATPLTCA